MPPVAKQKRKRCVYAEGKRRCTFEGTGEPPLCHPHRIAAAEAGRPRSALEVLSGALSNLLSGTPINAEATIGAGVSLFEQWKMGGNLGAAHVQGHHVQWDPSWIPGSSPRAAYGRTWGHSHAKHPPQQEPQPDPRIAIERQARRVMGFSVNESLTEDAIKDRRRKLAKRYHPDVAGGSPERMAAVNDAADVLIAALSVR